MRRRTFLVELGVITSAAVVRFPTASELGAWNDDEEICRRKFELADALGLRSRPFGEVIVEMGRSFLGAEYVANALEMPGEERLVVNLRGLDCVTFYEHALVFARCVKKNLTTFEQFKKELQGIRYRNGIIDGYPSRLHYTSDYFYENEQRGVWNNVTQELGGVPFRKNIRFMSNHPELYRQLRENPAFVRAIRLQEDEIMKREMFYVPKNRLSAIQEEIHSGDIIGFTTDIEGLDISHVGIAAWDGMVLRLMHAPQVGKKVEMSETPLVEYTKKNKRHTGIMVVRPIDPSLS